MKKNRLAVKPLERKEERTSTNPFSIFEISRIIEELVTDIVNAELAGETDIVEDLHSVLDELHMARNEKHESYVHVIKNAGNAADGLKAQIAEFRKKVTALENLQKRLKETLIGDLQRHDEQSVTAGNFKIARQTRDSVTVHIEAEQLPEEYQRVKVEADKTEIKLAMRRGDIIDGVELTETEHLRISLK